jgi:putative acetyltransferase
MNMNTPPVIRRYEPGDVHSLIEIYQRAIHVLAAPFYNQAQLDAWAPAVMDPAKWHARVSPQQTFIADYDGRSGAFITWDWTGHIDFMFTHPAFARRGLARALYVMAEEALRQHGTPRLFAEVSLAARPFFESCGFVAERERETDCRGQRLRQFIMSKTLAVTMR